MRSLQFEKWGKYTFYGIISLNQIVLSNRGIKEVFLNMLGSCLYS